MLNVSLTKKCMAIVTAGILLSSKSFLTPRIVEVKDPMKGVAISEETLDVNWDSISAENDFVLIHAGTGAKDDEMFEKNYKKAREKGLEVGVFVTNNLSTYYNNSPSDITKYAEYRYSHVKISQLIGKKISYPIYLRIDYGETPIEFALPKEHANDLFDRYELIMTHNKFIPGVYAKEEVYNYLRENVDDFDERFVHIIDESTNVLEEEKTEEQVEAPAETPVEEQPVEEGTVSKAEDIPEVTAEAQAEKLFDKEAKIVVAPLSTKVEPVKTYTNYHETSRAAIPVVLLSMDLLTCLGLQAYAHNEKKKRRLMKETLLFDNQPVEMFTEEPVITEVLEDKPTMVEVLVNDDVQPVLMNEDVITKLGDKPLKVVNEEVIIDTSEKKRDFFIEDPVEVITDEDEPKIIRF